jgi:hypothetical protein
MPASYNDSKHWRDRAEAAYVPSREKAPQSPSKKAPVSPALHRGASFTRRSHQGIFVISV